MPPDSEDSALALSPAPGGASAQSPSLPAALGDANPAVAASPPDSQARLAFLLELSDALRALTRPADIESAAARLLGQHLCVTWAYYGEPDQPPVHVNSRQDYTVDGAPSLQGVQPLWSFELLRDLTHGRTIAIEDLTASTRISADTRTRFGPLGLRSILGAPIVKEGRLLAIVVVADRRVRAWQASEIALVADVAHRTWEAVERARAEEALRASEQKYRLLFDSIDEAFCTIEVLFDAAGKAVDYRFLETNPAFERLTDRPNAVGRTARELVPGHEEFWYETFGRIARTGTPARFEHTAAALGKFYDVYAFRIGAPEAHHVAVIFTDIIARKRAEAALRESERRLRDNDHRKNYFLSMLGHELRNPLAAIRGGVDLLRYEKTSPETREKTLPIVAAQVAHMERLVDDLLDVTSVVEGRVQVRRERLVLQDVVQSAVEMLRAPLDAGGFDLKLALSPPPLVVLGDAVRLRQVVVNLLGNAIKYSGVSRRIEIAAAPDGVHARLSVRDHGQGISAALLPRIFEPFVQARPAVTLTGGLGLGLAVVRQLVELHGGCVEAASAGEQKGSEFVVYLPLAAPAP